MEKYPFEKVLQRNFCSETFEPSTSSTIGGHKTTFKIQKNAAIDENTVDFGIPDTQLLDNSFAKSKAEAVKQSVVRKKIHV